MWNPIQKLEAGIPLAKACHGGFARFYPSLLLFASLILFRGTVVSAEEVKLLNVSYDVTREFYQDYNKAFAKYWMEKTGDTVTVNQSHGGSSKQARSVSDGLEADVVTMNQPLDIDILHDRSDLIPRDWAARLPNKSIPYNSTILFVVRKGNPKNIRNWPDLIQTNVSVIIPNPKTSGNGRYSYLAAWGYALKKSSGDESKARVFVARLLEGERRMEASMERGDELRAKLGIQPLKGHEIQPGVVKTAPQRGKVGERKLSRDPIGVTV